MEWAEETIRRLRDLWDEGLSTADIGRRLGLTKNAVVGKAHRLDLPARPSPIRRDGQPRPVYVRKPRVLRETLPPLLSCLSSPTPPPEPRKAFIPRIKNPEAPMARPTAAKSVLNDPVCECKWPIGDPKDRKNFRFCDKKSRPGKVYCQEHVEKAYIKIERREDDDSPRVIRQIAA
jgi:GcrA cell cycle regulator